MVKLKKKSKRQKLSQKYNIEKKIRAHKKKLKKVAKDAKNIIKKKKKNKKITIPNSCPFKDVIIQEIQQKKAALEEEKRLKKLQTKLDNEQKQSMKKSKEEDFSQNEDHSFSMEIENKNEYEEFLQKALKKQNDYASESSDVSFSNSAEQDEAYKIKKQSVNYMKDIYKVIEMSDVLLEVLDSRNPNATRNFYLEEFIQKKQKRLVLILNKVDLIPSDSIQGWLKFLRTYYPTIAFKCASTQSKNKKLSRRNVSLQTSNLYKTVSSEVLGFSSLMHLLKNFSRVRESNHKKQITVGVFGYPNVGKSSLINSMIRKSFHSYNSSNSNSNHLQISSEPNCTKKLQFFQINKHIQIVDSPGVIRTDMLNPSNLNDLMLQNVYSISKMQNTEALVHKILQKISKPKIMKAFKIPNYETTKEFLYHLAVKRNKIFKNGVMDFEAVSRIFLKDWMIGKIKFFVAPPKDDNEHIIESKIVDKLSPTILFQMTDIYEAQDKEFKNMKSNELDYSMMTDENDDCMLPFTSEEELKNFTSVDIPPPNNSTD